MSREERGTHLDFKGIHSAKNTSKDTMRSNHIHGAIPVIFILEILEKSRLPMLQRCRA